MTKGIKSTEDLNENTHLILCKDGYWLYDKNRGMNLAIRAESEKKALVEALEYYQRRLKEVEGWNKNLNRHINTFLEGLGVDSCESD